MVIYKIDPISFGQVTKAKTLELADELLTRAQKHIVTNGTTDEGLLLDRGKVVDEGEEVMVFFDVPYSETIEYGRLPGTSPPPQALEGWIERKLGKSKKEAKSLSFVIARKIKAQGTDPQPYLRPAIAEMELKYKQ